MKLEEYIVDSSSGQYSRKVWLLPGASDESQRLCVFLDAEYYLRRMETSVLLHELQTSGMIPSVTCLFVSHLHGEARHYDYTCNPQYSQFIAHDLFHWARSKNDQISDSDHLICGLSLSGLASAFLALTCPELFSRALCQSGSFWWNSEWLIQSAPSYAPIRGRFWLSVGDQEDMACVSHPPTGMRQEVTQIAATETFARELQRLGATVSHHLFSGGHDTRQWQKELLPALIWLLGKNEKSSLTPQDDSR